MSYDLIIIDNRWCKNFNHARTINSVLEMVDGVLITIDDDVTLTEGWLEALLSEVSPETGIVSCTSHTKDNVLRSRGVTFRENGEVVLWKGGGESPNKVPAMGSFCSLLNKPAWPIGLKLDTSYKKYYFDPDICLSLWYNGLQVVAVPHAVIHMSGAQMSKLGIDPEEIRRGDRETFKVKWVDSGKIYEIYGLYGHFWPSDLQKILLEEKKEVE